MTNNRQRLRIIYAKSGNLRYISHLDLSRTWERAFRRANIPVAYSQGYHPHPKMVFAAALPVGCTGEAEVMDVLLDQPMPPRRVLMGLVQCVPEGLVPRDATLVYDRAPALPTLLSGAEYDSVVDSDLPIEEAQSRCAELLARDSIPREFRGKRYDLRPLIDSLTVLHRDARSLVVRARLAAGQRGTGRLEELLDELGWATCPHSCHRRGLLFQGERSFMLPGSESDAPSVDKS